MVYLVATHSFLMEIELDNAWRVQRYEILNTEHHYGTALLDDGGILSVKRKDNRIEAPELTTYRRNHALQLINTTSLAGEMADVHQIAYANTGLYLANTGYNSVVFQSLSDQMRHEYVFGNVRLDANHVNSVYPCGDQVLALLHNRSQKDAELAILHHDRANGFTLVHRVSLWHRGVHNVFVDGNMLYYNASGAHVFVVVDLARQTIARTIALPGYIKGLSVTQDYYVVGYSDLAARETRFTSKGYLAVLDRRSCDVVALIDLNFPTLPHPIGNVNEIRCLSHKELGQAAETPMNVDWRALRLAQRDHLHRIKMYFASRARQVKRFGKQIARGGQSQPDT